MNTNISRRNFVKAGAVAGMGLGLAACGGNSGSSNGSSSDTIKIGLMGPYTGDVAQYGLACRYGAELYVKQVNSNGGINGKPVSYTHLTLPTMAGLCRSRWSPYH